VRQTHPSSRHIRTQARHNASAGSAHRLICVHASAMRRIAWVPNLGISTTLNLYDNTANTTLIWLQSLSISKKLRVCQLLRPIALTVSIHALTLLKSIPRSCIHSLLRSLTTSSSNDGGPSGRNTRKNKKRTKHAPKHLRIHPRPHAPIHGQSIKATRCKG
jgi:hypothetical protein